MLERAKRLGSGKTISEVTSPNVLEPVGDLKTRNLSVDQPIKAVQEITIVPTRSSVQRSSMEKSKTETPLAEQIAATIQRRKEIAARNELLNATAEPTVIENKNLPTQQSDEMEG